MDIEREAKEIGWRITQILHTTDKAEREEIWVDSLLRLRRLIRNVAEGKSGGNKTKFSKK